VFAWGSNSFGQVCSSSCCSDVGRLLPKRVDAFKGVVVVAIAASSVHSAAITDAGHVFTWGSNKRGQLGRKEGFGTDQSFPTPKRVDALLPNHAHSAVLGDFTRVAVSCFHTCIVLTVEKETSMGRPQGQVWQWGYNAHFPSQVLLRHVPKDALLRQHHRNLFVPRAQQLSLSIVDLACAQQHSIGLSDAGNVYTWGHGPGVLAPTSNYVPLAHRAVGVCAAKDHCAVVLATGDVYTWGCGAMGTAG
ncbi:regulator of chromosome condensation (RCC1)-like protein, partial [Achlya hypogyna]